MYIIVKSLLYTWKYTILYINIMKYKLLYFSKETENFVYMK